MTGKSLLYLLGFLNSKVSEYFFSKIGTTTGVGTVRWKKFTIEQLYVPVISIDRYVYYDTIVNSIILKQSKNEDYTEQLTELNMSIYQELNLTDEEIKFIEKYSESI